MLVIGIDENGLGPRLGPLIATAVVLEVSAYDPRALGKRAARAGVGDSKVTAGFGNMKIAESIALALAEQALGRVPADVDELLTAIAVDGLLPLRSICPSASHPQCWSHALTLPAFGGEVALGRRALAKLARGGMGVRRARSAIACARAFNDGVVQLGSKLRVDLALFERLLEDGRRALGEDSLAICGMVGGIRRYVPQFSTIDPARIQVIEEVKGRSSYRIEGLGEVRFEVDSDARHPPVALASMLGKYVREVVMARQNGFYRARDPVLEEVSGYHDPVTARFVTATRDARTLLGIEDRCFERES